jgi:hypothetical protein
VFGLDGDQPSLEPIKSDAIGWIIETAVADGNSVPAWAPWTLALVAHMRDGLTPQVRDLVTRHHPDLDYFEEVGTPHCLAHGGYIQDGFSVSFPVPDSANPLRPASTGNPGAPSGRGA